MKRFRVNANNNASLISAFHFLRDEKCRILAVHLEDKEIDFDSANVRPLVELCRIDRKVSSRPIEPLLKDSVVVA